jgi:hypothetical protein
MRIISFIDQVDVIKKIRQHLCLWEESHAPPESDPPGREIKELTIDASYSPINLKILLPQLGADLVPGPQSRAKLT